MPAPIQVLIVDDSATASELLRHILESDPAIKVTHCVRDGSEALAALGMMKPDVITMDIHMPGMNGFETTRQIMETQPVPVVIVSSSFDPAEVANAFNAMEAGAVAALEKPRGPGHPGHAGAARQLITTVKAMAGVRVVKRWPRARHTARVPAPAPPEPRLPAAPSAEIRLIAIGASTGGPPVLQTLLAALPKPFPAPIVIVQHISAGFSQGLAEWLSQTAGLPVAIARDREHAEPGRAYLAPDGLHMRIEKSGRLSCAVGEPENGMCPAASCLFRSIAQNYGASAAGILLTGMGRDGADGLKLMRDAGAVTFAQDKESSIIHGMPGAAIALDAATYILSPERIAAMIASLLSQTERPLVSQSLGDSSQEAS